ncbi:MAG: GMC family oxidoreductase [Myxococcales bacterium]|nr:GMC family oxidoreductase [Myxococcota bacterium]MDW8282326.1 GMC family oxidoreductase [Myxococcales bacterium]
MSGGFVDATHDGLPLEEADYIVVGSGAGGGAAARVLALAGHHVAVLEEGPPFSPAEAGLLAEDTMERYLRHRGQVSVLGRVAIPLLQARCVGGTTTVNSAIIWRLPESVLRAWDEEHGVGQGLPESALVRAYEMIETEMSVRPVSPLLASRSDQLMHAGAERAGLAHRPIHRSERGCRGSGRCFHGCPNNAKQSTAINFLRRAAEHGAHVVAHAGVSRVLLEGDRAVGVQGQVGGGGPARGRRFRLRARRGVIVSAGVVQSAMLLHRSGVARGCEALGEHFMAHPGSTVIGLYDEPVRMWSGASQGHEVIGLRDTLGVKLETINVPPEILASRLPGAGQRFRQYLEQLDHLAAWAVAVRMQARGVARPAPLLGGARVHYTPEPHDMYRLREGMRRCAELHFLAGARQVLSGIHGMPPVLYSPDELRYYDEATLDPRAYHMVATHLFGTCRMGRDPRTSVVDPFLRVHGTRGLYVMDASVFPSNTGVNPQHGIMAVAIVAAERLAAA